MTESTIELLDGNADAYDVAAGEFVVVAPDQSDLKLYSPLCGLLRRVRRAFGIEAVFVTQWLGGEPVARWAAPAFDDGAPPACDPLEEIFGARLLSDSGHCDSFVAVPVITHDGMEHGTLCACTCNASGSEVSREALESVARLIANWFDEAAAANSTFSGFMPLHATEMGALTA